MAVGAIVSYPDIFFVVSSVAMSKHVAYFLKIPFFIFAVIFLWNEFGTDCAGVSAAVLECPYQVVL